MNTETGRITSTKSNVKTILCWKLVSENVTQVGGPMGRGGDRTWTNWVKYYSTAEIAKEEAQKDYDEKTAKRVGPIQDQIHWTSTPTGFKSPDLLFVMYHIIPVYVER